MAGLPAAGRPGQGAGQARLGGGVDLAVPVAPLDFDAVYDELVVGLVGLGGGGQDRPGDFRDGLALPGRRYDACDLLRDEGQVEDVG